MKTKTNKAKHPEETAMSRIPGSPSNRFWLYLIPGVAMLTWIIIVPGIWNIYLSFTNYRGIRPPVWAGLKTVSYKYPTLPTIA